MRHSLLPWERAELDVSASPATPRNTRSTRPSLARPLRFAVRSESRGMERNLAAKRALERTFQHVSASVFARMEELRICATPAHYRRDRSSRRAARHLPFMVASAQLRQAYRAELGVPSSHLRNLLELSANPRYAVAFDGRGG